MFMALAQSKGKLPCVRTLGVALLLVLASSVVASCEEQPSEQSSDADIDTAIPHCTSSADCSGGDTCAYEMLVGCDAIGVCRSFDLDAALGGCTPATTACGCDGKKVDIPECWMGFAPVPVFPDDASPCEIADAHASDAH